MSLDALTTLYARFSVPEYVQKYIQESAYPTTLTLVGTDIKFFHVNVVFS